MPSDRNELARLLLARWDLESELRLVQAQLKHVNELLKNYDEDEPEDITSAPAEQEDIYTETCGLRMQNGSYCARPTGHELAGSGEARQHRSAESLERRAASKNARPHSGRKS